MNKVIVYGLIVLIPCLVFMGAIPQQADAARLGWQGQTFWNNWYNHLLQNPFPRGETTPPPPAPTCDLNKYDHTCNAPVGVCNTVDTYLTKENISFSTIQSVLSDLHCH